MSFIALFLPAVISVEIRHKRNSHLTWNVVECIFEYAVLVVINVLLTMAVIVYVLQIDGDISAFNSFPFFTKYLAIAGVIAFFLPYVEEIAGKLISISFSVGGYDEKNKE